MAQIESDLQNIKPMKKKLDELAEKIDESLIKSLHELLLNPEKPIPASTFTILKTFLGLLSNRKTEDIDERYMVKCLKDYKALKRRMDTIDPTDLNLSIVKEYG